MRILILLISLFPLFAIAGQKEYWYNEVSLYGIIVQTEKMNNPDLQLNYSPLAYSLETGLNIDTEDGNTVRMGLHYYNLLNQSKEVHSPYIGEIFVERVFRYKDYYGTIGTGFKIVEDRSFNLPNGQEHDLKGVKWLDKFSARFAIGKRLAYNIDIELNHRSNWFLGEPFNGKWEYHQTSVCIAYNF